MVAPALALGAGGAALGAIGGLFDDGAEEANRQRIRLAQVASKELNADTINAQFGTMARGFSPIMAQMAQGAAVGANMDTQGLQANLARQGLGGTGLGAALGGGLRSGATFQTNQLRARLLSDLYGSAVQTQAAKAGIWAGVQVGQEPSAGSRVFRGAVQGAGAGFQTASLLGGVDQPQQQRLAN